MQNWWQIKLRPIYFFYNTEEWGSLFNFDIANCAFSPPYMQSSRQVPSHPAKLCLIPVSAIYHLPARKYSLCIVPGWVTKICWSQPACCNNSSQKKNPILCMTKAEIMQEYKTLMHTKCHENLDLWKLWHDLHISTFISTAVLYMKSKLLWAPLPSSFKGLLPFANKILWVYSTYQLALLRLFWNELS